MMRLLNLSALSLAALAVACSTEDAHDLRAGAQKPGLHSGADATIETTSGSSDASDTSTKMPNDAAHHPTTGTSAGTASAPDQGSTAAPDLEPRVGIRNFRQINDTMAALTGVPRTNATVAAAFATLTTALPDSNDIRTFNGSHQVSISKLAVEYCDAMVEDATLSAAAIPGFNFAALPAAAFDQAGKTLVAKSLIEKFWGTGLESLPSEDESVATIVQLIDAIAAGKAQTAVMTKSIVKGVCVSLLSTGQILFL